LGVKKPQQNLKVTDWAKEEPKTVYIGGWFHFHPWEKDREGQTALKKAATSCKIAEKWIYNTKSSERKTPLRESVDRSKALQTETEITHKRLITDYFTIKPIEAEVINHVNVETITKQSVTHMSTSFVGLDSHTSDYELAEISEGMVSFPKNRGGRLKGLDQIQDQILNGGETQQKGKNDSTSINCLSVNPNGLRTVPLLSLEVGNTNQKKDKCALLNKIAKKHGIEILLWQEGHGYNPTSHPAFWKANSIIDKNKQTGLLILNPEIKVLKTWKGENFVIAEIQKKNCTIKLGSVYLPPNKLRAEKTMTELKETIKLLDKIILAGDFNCTETDGIKDCLGGDRKDPFRDSFRNFINSCKLADAELWEDVANVTMTHRNHSCTKGARLDRIYGDEKGLEEIRLTPGYIKFLYGDHIMRSFEIGHPEGEMHPKREPQLSESDLAKPEVRALVHDLLKEQAYTITEHVDNGNPCLDLMFQEYDDFKKIIRKKGCSLVSKLKHKEKSARAALARKIAHWEEVASKRTLNPFETKELKEKQQELLFLACKEQEEVKKKNRILDIQTGGKSNKRFFACQRAKKKPIKNMVISDSGNPDDPRSDHEEVIGQNFRKTYTETYRKKQIDTELLNELLEKIDIPLTEEHIKILSSDITQEDIMKVLETREKDVVGGLDSHLYTMYNCNPEAAGKILAAMGNFISKTGDAPPSFKTNVVTFIPKVEDPFNTGLYRPITLANADYKIILNVWASRLGPILNEIIGEHQKGFIPARDGRENVIVVQAAMDKMAKAIKGGGIFLDLEKAFDRVSHEALQILLEKFNFPVPFRSTVSAIYDNSEVLLSVGGSKLVGPIKVYSGTKQGCPLSPLLFTLIAELLTQCIIKDPLFVGIFFGECQKKTAAYADDTAILCSDVNDFNIALHHLDRYEKATGMKQNKKKTEIVTNSEELKNLAQELGYATPSESKYLGCPVGINPDYSKLWQRVINKMKVAAEDWRTRSTAIGDRVMIAKTMILSKIWYYGSILPLDEAIIKEVENITTKFVWNNKTPKVGRYQTRKTKINNGLNLWDIESKIRGLQCNWILEIIQETKPPGAIKHLVKEEIANWASKGHARSLLLDPDDNRAEIQSKPIAEIIFSWSKISRPFLKPEIGSWVTKIDREKSKKNEVTETINGFYIVDSINGDNIHTTEYFWDEDGHLDEWKRTIIPDHMAAPIEMPQFPALGPLILREYLLDYKKYVHTIWDQNAQNLKGCIYKGPLKAVKSMNIREFGPKFPSNKKNEVLYKACLFNKKADNGFKKETKPKVNKWALNGDINDLKQSAKDCWSTYADSKSKSANWLLINHALPVMERIKKKGEITSCPRCNKGPVDLDHVFNTCPKATAIWTSANAYIKKCMGINNELSLNGSLNPNAGSKNPAGKIIGGFNSIVVRQIWLDYCNLVFGNAPEGDNHVDVVSSAIHRELNLMIDAELGLLKNDLSWWKRKMIFSPALELNKEHQIMMGKLSTRIDSLTQLLRGNVTDELASLSW
jgi:hypothetical protein